MNDQEPLQDILTRIDVAAAGMRPGVKAFIADVAKVMPTLEEMTPRLVALFLPLTTLALTSNQHFFIAVFAVNGYCGREVSFICRSRGSRYLESCWHGESGISKLTIPALMYARTLFAHLKHNPDFNTEKVDGETLIQLVGILPERDW